MSIDLVKNAPKTPAREASIQSMELAMAGDGEGWLALFADDAVVQDPYGKSPMDPEGLGRVGKEEIGKFCAAYIRPGAIKFEVILSFLGLGLEPSEASWGNMISKGAGELLRADTVWWQITTATAALFGLVLSVNLFADALRDALDPRLRK